MEIEHHPDSIAHRADQSDGLQQQHRAVLPTVPPATQSATSTVPTAERATARAQSFDSKPKSPKQTPSIQKSSLTVSTLYTYRLLSPLSPVVDFSFSPTQSLTPQSDEGGVYYGSLSTPLQQQYPSLRPSEVKPPSPTREVSSSQWKALTFGSIFGSRAVKGAIAFFKLMTNTTDKIDGETTYKGTSSRFVCGDDESVALKLSSCEGGAGTPGLEVPTVDRVGNCISSGDKKAEQSVSASKRLVVPAQSDGGGACKGFCSPDRSCLKSVNNWDHLHQPQEESGKRKITSIDTAPKKKARLSYK